MQIFAIFSLTVLLAYATLTVIPVIVVITDGKSSDPDATVAAAAKAHAAGVTVVAVGVGKYDLAELQIIASSNNVVVYCCKFYNLGGKECPEGYERNPEDKNTCIDVNECNNSKQPCQEVCVNMIGSYRCKCNPSQVVDEKATTKCISLPPCTKALDVIFVLDASVSNVVEYWVILQDFVARLISHFTVSESAAQFGALTFSQDVVQLFQLNTYSTIADIASAVLSANYTQGITNTHTAFDAIDQNQLFSTASGGRSNASDVVVVLTDEESSQSEATIASANRLKESGIKIVPVGISSSVNPKELAAIASNVKEAVLVGDFELLDYIEQRVTNILCDRYKGKHAYSNSNK